MMSKQITDRMKELAQAETESAFSAYCDQAFEIAEQTIETISDADKVEIAPLARQAFEQGITPKRLSEILIESQS